jgi:multidrug resistance efflux pump
MGRLVLFLSVVVALFGALGAFDWWLDPTGIVWKPDAVAAARHDG